MKAILVWLFRAAWLSLVFAMGPAIGDATDHRSRAVQLVATIGCWVVWSVVLVASLVPTTVSLTAVRVLVPGTPVVSVIAWSAGAGGAAAGLALGASLVATVAAFSGELGESFAQGSAYGHERRLPLRPPAAVAVATFLAWAVLVSSAIVGGLGLAARCWLLGAPLGALSIAAAPALARRFHRLSKRWLVVVPAGLVVHDHVILAETVLFQKQELAGVSLALVGSAAADLTGTALGPVVEVRLRELGTVVLAAPPRGQTRALHVGAILVSPTRPGRLLQLLHDEGVGAIA
jgi:hypothetical protein